MSQSKTPECRRCNTQSIIADAGMLTYKPYFYCRKCKIELDFYGYERRALKNVADETTSEQLPESADEKWGYPGYVTFDSSLGGSWPNGVITGQTAAEIQKAVEDEIKRVMRSYTATLLTERFG